MPVYKHDPPTVCFRPVDVVVVCCKQLEPTDKARVVGHATGRPRRGERCTADYDR